MENSKYYATSVREGSSEGEEDENDMCLTLAANKSLDLSKSLTNYCNRFADLGVDDIPLTSDTFLPDTQEAFTDVQVPLRLDVLSVVTPHNRTLPNRRENIISEILRTEQSYCAGLFLLIDHFFGSLKRLKVVGDDAFKVMFQPSLVEIYHLHCNLARELDLRVINWTPLCGIGDLFISYFTPPNCDLVRLYQEYVKGFSDSLIKIRKVSRRNREFFKLLKSLEDEPKCKRLDIASYLLTPVQRIPRYILLLKELVRHTSPEHTDRPLIDASLRVLGLFLDELNSSISDSIELVSKKSSIKPKIKFPKSISFKTNTETSGKLKRQISFGTFDPRTSTPIKHGNEVRFRDSLPVNFHVRVLKDKNKLPGEPGSPESLCTYDEYLARGSESSRDSPEDEKQSARGTVPKPTPSLLPHAGIEKLSVVSSLAAKWKLKTSQTKKGPLVASHDIVGSKPPSAPLAITSNLKRTQSGNSPMVKENFSKIKKFSDTESLCGDEGASGSSALAGQTMKSIKNKLKNMIKYTSLSSIQRNQNSTSSLEPRPKTPPPPPSSKDPQ